MTRLTLSCALLIFISTVLVPAIGSSQAKPAPAKKSVIRTWADVTGKFSIKARLIESKDGSVSLEKDDGKIVTLPLTKLSDTDQKHIASLERKSAEEARGPWRITSHTIGTFAKNSNGGITISSLNYVTIKINYRGLKDDVVPVKFKLRNGEEGDFVGNLNNTEVKGTRVTLLFANVPLEAVSLYLCDDKGNSCSIYDIVKGP